MDMLGSVVRGDVRSIPKPETTALSGVQMVMRVGLMNVENERTWGTGSFPLIGAGVETPTRRGLTR